MSTYKINAIFIGDESVGKTTFLKRHLTGEFIKSYNKTEEIKTYELNFNTEIGVVSFNITDLPAHLTFSDSAVKYFLNLNVCFVFYSLTDSKSTEKIPLYIEEVRKYNPKIKIILCGNKADVKNDCKPYFSYFPRENYEFFVSAKSNYNFEKPFLYAVRLLSRNPDLGFVPFTAITPPEITLSSGLKKQLEIDQLQALNHTRSYL